MAETLRWYSLGNAPDGSLSCKSSRLSPRNRKLLTSHAIERIIDFIEYLLCDSSNVDVALTWNADKQKAPRDARPKALVLLGNFGCGSRI